MQIDKMNAIDDVVFSQKNISVEPKPTPDFFPLCIGVLWVILRPVFPGDYQL